MYFILVSGENIIIIIKTTIRKQEFNQSNERILLKEEKDVDNMIKLITSGATYNPLKVINNLSFTILFFYNVR